MSAGLCLGPSFGIKLNTNSKFEVDGKESTDFQSTDFSDNSTDLDIGLNVGGNFTYKNFFLDIRYIMSLKTIVKEITTGNTSTTPDVKNAVISFMVGYSIPQ